MTTTSNRGGKRPGSGRPRSEKTVQIRVPVGAVELVRVLIDGYKAGLKNKPEIEYKQVDWTDPEKPKAKKSPKIKKAVSAAAVADALRLINEKSNRKERRAMIAKHGSIENAAVFFAEHEASRASQ